MSSPDITVNINRNTNSSINNVESNIDRNTNSSINNDEPVIYLRYSASDNRWEKIDLRDPDMLPLPLFLPIEGFYYTHKT